jgi:hypothetical protein
MVVSFHDLAKLELNEAADYYESESVGLGRHSSPRSSVARTRSSDTRKPVS